MCVCVCVCVIEFQKVEVLALILVLMVFRNYQKSDEHKSNISAVMLFSVRPVSMIEALNTSFSFDIEY